MLIAGLVAEHAHHNRALPLITDIIQGNLEGVIASHSIAECFVTLTRASFPISITPAEAEQLIHSNIVDHFAIQELSAKDYLVTTKHMRQISRGGPILYDALLLWAAEVSGAERIYTFNISDMRSLATDAILTRIVAP